MFKEKRGLSDVVTVTLIILLAIAAVVIVWAFVRSTLEDVGEEITGACITTVVKLVGTCNAANGAVTVRNDGRQEIINGVKLVYYATTAADSASETRDADCSNIAPLAQAPCTPQAPVGGSARPSFGGAAPQMVRAAALIGTGPNQVTCPPSESVACVP